MAKQQTATIQLPVSEWHGLPIFADYLTEIQRQYDVEKDLKNAAFGFLVSKGLYNEFHKYLHDPDKNKADDILARLESAIDYIEQNEKEAQAAPA